MSTSVAGSLRAWASMLVLALPLGCDGLLDLDDLTIREPTGSSSSQGGAGGDGCSGDRTLCDGECRDVSVDASHCGVCNHSCLGGACVDALCRPTELDKSDRTYKHITLRGTRLFWTVAIDGSNPGEVRSVEVAGDTPAEVVLESSVDPDFIRATGERVFYTSFFDNGVFEATTQEKPVVAALSDNVFGLAFDSAHVYFHLIAADGEVARAPLEGGPAETVIPAQRYGIGLEVDGGVVYWSTWGPQEPRGTVSRHELATSIDTELHVGLRPSSIALDETYVYWASQDQSVWRVEREGGSAAEQLVAPVGTLSDAAALLVVDDTRVYWVIRANLYSAPKGGGPATLLFNGVWGLTQDEAAVYFTTGDDGRVMKLAK